MDMYRLTQEGRKYLEKGLPEMNLVLYLEENGPTNLEHIQMEMDDVDIAVSWAKKNGWIELHGGQAHPKSHPTDYGIEDGLLALEDGEKPEGEIMETLLERNLVEEIREDIEEKAREYLGEEITVLPDELIKTGYWREVDFRPYNVEAAGEPVHPGKRQFYRDFLRRVRRELVELGFREYSGPLIELEFWNFDALFQPQNHPARDWSDTYTMKEPESGELPEGIADAVAEVHQTGGETGSDGWGYEWSPDRASRLMPRSHDTAASPRLLASDELEIPGKYFNISRCYRPDEIDATHDVEFDQVGGIVIDEDLHLRNLLGVLEEFATEVAGAEKIKFVPAYFPFTEPSVEVFGYSDETGWIEVAGAGIFREELTEPLGIEQPVIAWGIGIGRLAMLSLGVRDIRNLFSRDLEYLRNRRVR